MPVHAVTLPSGKQGFQWGQHGGKYRDRAGAERQAAAAHAHGYEGDWIKGFDMAALATVPNAGPPALVRRAKDSNIRSLVRNLLQFFAEEEDEPEHADAEPTRAAGVAVQAPDGSMLFMRRKDTGDWAFPGGVAEGDEDPEATARRELAEETGYTASTLEPAFASRHNNVDFATFLHHADAPFDPKMNDEHTEFKWASKDDLPKPLHRGVAMAFAGDGMATDPPVSEAQRRAMFAAASGHSKLGIPKKVGEEFVGEDEEQRLKLTLKMPSYTKNWLKDTDHAVDVLAFDKASARSYDADGRLHVAATNISKAAINPYKGSEIPDHEKLGLDPDKVYNLLRHPDELKRAAPTFNNLPLLSEHVPVTSDEHPKDLVIGSTGTDAEFVAPYLRNSLVVWPQEHIDRIEADKQKELSSAYRYRADMTPGTYDGQPYDGIMRDLVGNHVALVKEGRAGADVVVGDAALDSLTTSHEETDMPQAKTRLGIYVHGGLGALVRKPWDKGGKQIAVALDAALKGVTAAIIGDKAARDRLKTSIAAIPGIAQDADLPAMHHFIDHLDEHKAADLDLVEDPNKGAKDETEEEKEKREEKEASDKKARDEWEASPEHKAAKDSYDARRAKDEPPNFEGEPKVMDKKAMDAAIQAVVTPAIKQATEDATKIQRGIREAERFVRPWVGDLNVALDSAEQVYGKALEMLGVKHEGVHPSALRTIIEHTPKPGDKPATRSRDMAADEAGAADFAKRYPGAARIGIM